MVNETGIVDVPQHRMCHFMVLYSCQVVQSLANITAVVRMLRMVPKMPLILSPLFDTFWIA